MAYFKDRLEIRITLEVRTKLKYLLERYPEFYKSESQAVRAAIIRLFNDHNQGKIIQDKVKCRNCGQNTSTRHHTFPIGPICNGCYLAAKGEQLKKWQKSSS